MDREHTIPQAGGGGHAQWTVNIKHRTAGGGGRVQWTVNIQHLTAGGVGRAQWTVNIQHLTAGDGAQWTVNIQHLTAGDVLGVDLAGCDLYPLVCMPCTWCELLLLY